MSQCLAMEMTPESDSNQCTHISFAESDNHWGIVSARFMYGNYDVKNSVPKFDIYLGTKWRDY